MDIAALSVTMHQADLMQSASVAVMKMAMDTAVEQANNIQQLLQAMERSVNPHLGGTIDIKA